MLFYTDSSGTFYLGSVRHCGSVGSFHYAELEAGGFGISWNTDKITRYTLVCPD